MGERDGRSATPRFPSRGGASERDRRGGGEASSTRRHSDLRGSPKPIRVPFRSAPLCQCGAGSAAPRASDPEAGSARAPARALKVETEGGGAAAAGFQFAGPPRGCGPARGPALVAAVRLGVACGSDGVGRRTKSDPPSRPKRLGVLACLPAPAQLAPPTLQVRIFCHCSASHALNPPPPLCPPLPAPSVGG
jgi:hypothetical protein